MNIASMGRTVYLPIVIYHKKQPNVGKYTVRPMDGMGHDVFNGCFWFQKKVVGSIVHPPIGRKNITYIIHLYTTYSPCLLGGYPPEV